MFGKKKSLELDKETGDVSLIADVFSLVEELASAEKHAKNNYKLNLDLGRKERAELFLEVSDKIRKIRFEFQKILDGYKDDETHCFNKHLSIAMKNLDEVGNRFFESKKEMAMYCYNKRYELFEDFLTLNELGGEK